MERRKFLLMVTSMTSSSIAGCLGGGAGGQTTKPPTRTNGEETASDTPTMTVSPTLTPASVGQREYPDYSWEKLDRAQPQITGRIELRNTAFLPLVAEVPKGSPIEFVNRDSFGHTVTIPALDINEQLSGGDSVSRTFTEVGMYEYVCTAHPPGMLGRLVVSNVTPMVTETKTNTDVPDETSTPTTESGPGYY